MEKYKRENRIAEALALRGLKQADLSEATGIFKTSINGWIKQKYQPKQDAIYKMAKVLGVSEMWLAGYDVPMERHKNNSAQIERILQYMKRLHPEQLDTIESMVTQLSNVNEVK